MESTLHHLDVTTVADEERMCAICLEPLLDQRQQRVIVGSAAAAASACSHLFHQECIVEWLLQHDECPVCRGPFVHGNGTAATAFDSACLHDNDVRMGPEEEEEAMETEAAVL